MSTQAVSNTSILRDLQSLIPDHRDRQNRATTDSLTQAFVVTITASQGSSAATQTPSGQDNHEFYHERKADLAQLGQALRSGDTEAAQAAYDALVALGQNGPLKDGQTFHRADRAQDFAAIGQALASGDLTGASAAFSSLVDTFGHHGSTVGGFGTPPGPPTLVPPPSTTGSGGPQGPPEIIINLGGNSTGQGGDIVVNLPAATNSPEEVQINLGGQQGGQFSIDIHPLNGGGEAVAINLPSGASNSSLVLNLFQSNASSAPKSSLSLNA